MVETWAMAVAVAMAVSEVHLKRQLALETVPGNQCFSKPQMSVVFCKVQQCTPRGAGVSDVFFK